MSSNTSYVENRKPAGIYRITERLRRFCLSGGLEVGGVKEIPKHLGKEVYLP